MYWRITVIITAVLCLTDVRETAAQAPVLHAVLRNPNAVFAPQEAVIADITLSASNVSGTRQYPLNVVLTRHGKTLAELETAIIANAPQMLPVSFVAPESDGIYDITVTVKPHAVVGFLRNITETPLVARQQFAVVNSKGTPRTDGDLTLLPVKRDLLDNAADGFVRRNLLPLPPVHFNPQGMLRLPTIKFGGKDEKPVTGEKPNTAALRLPISIDEAGKPYLLEIEYPLNAQQQLGAVIEDDSMVISATKIDIDDEIIRDKRTEQSGTHKILFRPKSRRPQLILVNLLQPQQPPVIHGVRVAGLLTHNSGETLRIPKRFEGTSQRKFIGIIDGDILKRPRLDSSAPVPPLTVSSVFETVNHLTDILCHDGYDGLMLTVSSATVHLPDSALEMLFRQFDRDQLTLFPVVKDDTAAPQQTLQDMVAALTERYHHHPSFGGVSVFQSGHWSAANVPNTALFYHPVENGCVSVPADYQNRRRFVKQLAQGDVLTFFDGGEQLPAGEQDSLCDLLAAYRKLPPLPFKTLHEKALPDQNADKSLQPLTVRYLNAEDGFYVYLVNDAPYQIDADIVFDTAVQTHMTELSGRRMIRSLNNKTWRATLLPYDFLAVKLDSADTSVQHVSVIRPPEICGENGRLKELTDELGQRIYAAKPGVVWDKLPNAGFEETAMTGWLPIGQSTFTVSPDTEHYYNGKVSAKLTNQAAESGSLMTETLSPPCTGRLWLAAFVGVPADEKISETVPATRIPLNFILTAEHAGKPLYRHAAVGGSLQPYLAKIQPKNGIRWQQVIVPFDQLPTTGMENIRIGFQVTGQASLWIDDVTLYTVAFSSEELKELQRMMLVADTRLRESRFSELLTLLEGQQSRFLFKNVPLPALTPKPVAAAVSAPVAAQAPTAPADTQPPEKATMYQRVKSWLAGGL